MTIHSGSCHCGNIRFKVEGAVEQAMECNCSHCSRKGYLLWFVPREKLQLEAAPDRMATYHFNKHVIDHHFCRDCGCAPFGFGTAPDGTATAAVNIRCLETIELDKVKRVPVDGKSY
ncbi:GFA family protein [Pararhizobium haloflavum]|uniref:GFA family protein n=1 Tax=Pararhizobium haloflavum TaxID=2037914 RepID=UPI000C19B705|nr:GFA family protein [Pararhizobium haloflavum]